MPKHVDNIIIGQGMAGSALAWTLHWSGQTVVLIDGGEPNTASRVAAGLVTPITGKRLVKSSEFDDYWSAALAFYRRVERETGTSLFIEAEMVRLFEKEQHREEFLERSDAAAVAGTSRWKGALQKGGEEQTGVTLAPAGRLNVAEYLKQTRTFFEAKDAYFERTLELAVDLEIAGDRVAAAFAEISADRIVLCQGAVENTELFAGVPNNPSRGDILRLKIPRYKSTEVVHRSIWVAPNTDGTQMVGATYDWKNVKAEPSESGKNEILGKLSRIIDGDVKVTEHIAGVRPTMKDYQPVIGRHPFHRNVFVFNGLGSKGTLRAPLLAAELSELITKSVRPRESRSYERLLKGTRDGRPRSLTAQAQDKVRRHLELGDRAIDATVGNGFDTCFLSKNVGEKGEVIGFDVQKSALLATSRRLEAESLSNVTLYERGHESLGEMVESESVTAVMFNLGYLPRHDHSVITKPATSEQAIAAAGQALKPGGVMTVLAYRGHDGGAEEYAVVERLLLSLAEDYDQQKIDSVPAKATSPVLFVLVKRKKKNDQKD